MCSLELNTWELRSGQPAETISVMHGRHFSRCDGSCASTSSSLAPLSLQILAFLAGADRGSLIAAAFALHDRSNVFRQLDGLPPQESRPHPLDPKSPDFLTEERVPVIANTQSLLAGSTVTVTFASGACPFQAPQEPFAALSRSHGAKVHVVPY